MRRPPAGRDGGCGYGSPRRWGCWCWHRLARSTCTGYDDSTGDPAALLGNLAIFAPLYGGAALLIREITRRCGRGWPTILLLGLAFGVLQAGLLDHSMFNPSYRDIEYWDDMFSPTYVSWLGFSPELAVMFTTGHMIFSMAAPIAVAEALVPRRRITPWLRWPGLAVTATAFLLAAYVVVWWHLDTEDFVPSGGQLAGGTLLAQAAVALLTEPIGEVSAAAKLAHNTLAMITVVGLVTVATLRLRRSHAHPNPHPAQPR